jgi:hypothetical protein
MWGRRSARRRSHPAARRDVDAAVRNLLRRVLDQRDDPTRHEPARPDGRAAAGHLGDLDDAAGGRNLEAAAVLRRRDLERLDALTRIDYDLDSIALHARTITHAGPRTIAGTGGRRSGTIPLDRR